MKNMRILGAMMTGLVLAACGGGGGGGGIAVMDLEEKFAEATCDTFFRCCDDAERMAIFGFLFPNGAPATAEECSAQLAMQADGEFEARLQMSIDNGNVTYSASSAADCLEAMMGVQCGTAVDPFTLTACQNAIKGNVADGAACEEDFECSSGYCTSDKLCAAIPGAGQPCDGRCTSGNYCDFQSGMCAALKADGEACFGGNECTSNACTNGMCGGEPQCNGA